MVKVDIWMPLYIADYLADTSRLTTEQHGAYLLLLMDYWRNGALPDNDATLAQITRMSPDAWSNARSILQAFFKQCNGMWVHERVEAELAKARTEKESWQRRAKTAADARWAKKNSEVPTSKHASSNATSNAPSNAQAMREDMLEECPSPSPSPSPKTSKSFGRASALPENFAPNDVHIELAQQERIDLAYEFPKFCDYHAAKGSVMKDWNAALRTWIRNASQFRKPGQSPPYQTAADKSRSIAEALTGSRRERPTPDIIDIN